MRKQSAANRVLAILIAVIMVIGLIYVSPDIAFAADEDDLTVKAFSATYLGKADGDYQSFRSIKYATTERWQESVFVGEGTETVDCTGDKAIIPYQSAGAIEDKTEDYVTLDIYRSGKRTKTDRQGNPVKLPVFVQMNYGGGTGSNSNGADFKELLSEYPDIIIVNVTMRVSYFSTINLKLFEGYDDANEGGKYDKSNDVGRTDLIASLKWINANIAAFGGDPANVSLYGASGGAVTACTPLILEDTGKYFKRVILSSGVALDTISVGSLEENNVQTREFIKYFNEVRDPKIEVKTVEDALALTPEQILEAQRYLSSQCIGAYFPGSKSKTFSNIIDGLVIKEDYLQTMIDNIKNYDIEVMAITSDGEYDNDLSKARLGLPADATDEEYAEAALNAIVTANWSKLDPDQGGAENASELIQGYVTRGEEIGRGTILSYQDLKNDINQKCSAVMLCELVEALGGKAYLASYNYNTNDSARGAHAASVRPVIGVLSQQVPKAMEMGKAWRAAVVGFVTNGNPNANTYFQKAGINWPTFKAETHEELVLDTEFGVEKISDVRWEDINSLLPLFREYAQVEALLDEALEDQLAVKATTGTYIGAENEKGIQSFRSIKYATTKRWEESVPVGPSDEVFDASGSISVVPYQSAGATKTEDYVTLDIYRSSKNTNSKSPVIMQVNYGGGTGSNSNGADFSGILTDYPELVIVNVTMRVSYFSTINLSLFDGYKEANVGGKYDKSNDAGRTDLIAALKWINSNIAAFGGDPENVTITGGSGGAVTACTPLILEGTGQYFKRVVLSSGVALDDISVGSQEENDVATREFMKATGAKTVEEALALTPEDILKAQSAFTSQCIGAYFPGSRSKTFSNIIDGIVIKENYLETMMDNIVNYGIEVMAITSDGEYDNDLSKQRLGLANDVTDEEYAEAALNAIVTANWSKLDPDKGGVENASEIIQGYVDRGAEIGRDTVLSYKDLKNDINQKGSAVMICELVNALGGNAYLGSYNYTTNANRAGHNQAIRTYMNSPEAAKNPDAYNALRAAVVSFATYGDPNEKNAEFTKAEVSWPAFDPKTHEEFVIAAEYGTEAISDTRWADLNSLLPLFREYPEIALLMSHEAPEKYEDLVGLKEGSAQAYVAGEIVELEAPVITKTVNKRNGVAETAKTTIPAFFFDTVMEPEVVFYAPIDLITKIDEGAKITFYNEGKQAAIVLSDGTEIRVNGTADEKEKVALNSNYAQLIVDERLVRLADNVIFENGTIYLPVKAFAETVLGKFALSDADIVAVSDNLISSAADVRVLFAYDLEDAEEGMAAPAHTLVTENVPLLPATITSNDIGTYVTSTADDDKIGDGLDHEWCEYVPASYDGSKPVTLLVYLHGNGGRGMNYLSRDNSYRYLAELNNIILIFPSSTGGGIQPASQKPTDPARGAAWQEVFRIAEEDNKDINFLDKLIDYAIEKYNIDETRIFMGGFSNGDLMSNRFAASSKGNRLAGLISGGGAVHYSSAWTTNPLENMDRLDEIEAAPIHNVPVYQHRGSNDLSALTVNEFGNRNPQIIDPVAEGQKMASSNEYAKQMWIKKNGASQYPEISIAGINNYEIYRGENGDVLFQSQHGDPHQSMVDAAQTAYDQLLNRYTRDPETHKLTDNGITFKGDEGAVALVAGAKNAYVNNEVVELSNEVVRENGLIYMPVEVLSKAFGGHESTVITLSRSLISAEVLGQNRDASAKSSIKITAGSKYVTIDDVTITLDAPALSIGGVLYVPTASFANKVLGLYTTECVDAIYLSDHAGIMNYATYYTLYRILDDEDFSNFVAMSNIMGIPTEITVGQEIDLVDTAVIFPTNATKTLEDIEWSVFYGDTKGAPAGTKLLAPETVKFDGTKFTATEPGYLRIAARVDGGTGTGVDDISARFLQTFDIIVKEAPEVTTATVTGISLDLQDKISIQFKIQEDENVDYAELALQKLDGTFEEPVKVALENAAGGVYTVKYSEITTRMISQGVKLTVYDKNGNAMDIYRKTNDKTYTKDDPLVYSAADWCNAAIEHYGPDKTQKTAWLAMSVLNLGGEAQKYFDDYNPGNPANPKGYLADDMAAFKKDAAYDLVSSDANAKQKGYSGMSLDLAADTRLRVKFNAEVEVTVDGKAGTLVKEGDKYVLDITGLRCIDLDQFFKVKFKATDGSEITMDMCALSWSNAAYDALGSNPDNQTLKLAKAVALYSAAAENYFK